MCVLANHVQVDCKEIVARLERLLGGLGSRLIVLLYPHMLPGAGLDLPI